jgi:phage gp46-like protein
MSHKDIRITWDPTAVEGFFTFDAALQDLGTDEGLETAVIISLYTDARAADDDVLPDLSDTSRRGWWGDLINPESDGDSLGSKLWLLERSSTVADVPLKLEQYVREALQWMLDDGVAIKLNVEVERQGSPGNDRLAFLIQILKVDGSVIAFNFEDQWAGQAARG